MNGNPTLKIARLEAFRRDEIARAIEDAIQRLPKRGGGITSAGQAKLRILGAIDMARVVDGPTFQQAGEKATAAELRKLAKLCGELANHVDSLRGPALHLVSVGDITNRLRDLAEVARSADWADAPPHLISGGGAPRHRGARFVAAVACAAFEGYTGKRATVTTRPDDSGRSGKFIAFVREIFAAGSIDADPVRCAEEACKVRLAMKLPTPKSKG